MSRAAPATVLVLEPIPENLLREPVDYLFAEHYRQRQVLAALDDFLDRAYFERELTPEWQDVLGTVVGYLEVEFPLHIADEDMDVFPALRRACEGDAGTAAVLQQLSNEHKDEPAELKALIGGLKQLLVGAKLPDSVAYLNRTLRFVEMQRHHLIWENNVVLPLARRKLSTEEMQKIGTRMAKRRNLSIPD